MSFDIRFYENRRVFVTGHTGFKGAWLCKLLAGAGAEVTGVATAPEMNATAAAATVKNFILAGGSCRRVGRKVARKSLAKECGEERVSERRTNECGVQNG